MAVRVGIAGVSGYTGVELLRILTSHPEATVTALCAGRSAGQPLSTIWPGLSDLDAPPVDAFDADLLAERCDAVMLALPHGVSGSLVPDLLERGLKVIDLGADFRLRDPASYAVAYGKKHPSPSLLEEAVYGIPELNRGSIPAARLIANPGCYPTATILAAAPLVQAGLARWVVADCVSGVSGAGRRANARNLYCEVQESVIPYKIAGGHRHTVEIEQALGVTVTFTPHLVPMRRGMLATVHVRPEAAVDAQMVTALYEKQYGAETMVTLRDAPPATADVRGTARAHVHTAVDPQRGVITVICAIDNLGKGAAGQAVQNLNICAGLPETMGLPMRPWLP
ncbi:MAG: N-acetyl-gamma-glutamyl-phosphate reductase [Myxococcota bacterium]